MKETINVLLTLPNSLNDRLRHECEKQRRKRNAQIIFILEKFFEARDAHDRKVKAK